MIVGAWVVLAASYEAKAYGVRTAMGGAQARRLCPDAVVVEPRMSAYSEASKAMYRVFDDTSPFVEGLSIDEAFLDVRGLELIAGTPTEIAVRLRRQVRERVGLPITVGVARTKFLAKVASGVAKPDGLLVVEPDRELAFLHPLPVERLWGVGRVTAAQAARPGIATVGEVAAPPRGDAGGDARTGLGPPPPRARPQPRSPAGASRAPPPIDRRPAGARSLVEIARRSRRDGRRTGRPRHEANASRGTLGRTVVLRLRFDDFSRATRSRTLPRATSQTETVLSAARDLLATAMPMIEHRGITLVGVAVANLVDNGAVQLMLPIDRATARRSTPPSTTVRGSA